MEVNIHAFVTFVTVGGQSVIRSECHYLQVQSSWVPNSFYTWW